MASLLLLVFVAITAFTHTGAKQCTLSSSNNHVMVSCSDLHLTSVPPSVPDDVTWLDLSRNVISSIRGDTFNLFQRLHVLDLSYNTIKHLDKDAFLHLDKLEVFNLTHNNLTAAESRVWAREVSGLTQTTGKNKGRGLTGSEPPNKKHNSQAAAGGILTSLKSLRVLHLDHNVIESLNADYFIGLSSLKTLTLSHNLLETVHNDTFQGLTQLEVLTLDGNKLQSLEAGSFRGLSHLGTLSLSHNQLLYTDVAIPPGVFAPVGATLTSLSVEGNLDDLYDGGYPQAAFRDLSALQTLVVDTMPWPTFSEGFAAMRHLTTLDLSYKCRLRAITNQTFLAFTNSSLQSLFLSECQHVIMLDACAFCPLKDLTNLHMSRTQSYALNLNAALQSFNGFQNRNNLSVVILDGFSSFAMPRGVSLDRHSTQFMHNTCVKSLNLQSNHITSVMRSSLGRRGSIFNECIQHIDLSNNFIWVVDIFAIFQALAFSPRLESVHCELQKVFSLEKALYSFGNKKDDDAFSIPWDVTIQVAPTLSFVNFSSSMKLFGTFSDSVVVKNADNLRTLDMSYNRIYGCTATFKGLEHLQNLNLSGNDCRIISDLFFDAFPKLKTLTLQRMNFDPLLFLTRGSRLFSSLTRLEILDLSHNDLSRLPSDLLHAQTELRQLLLPGNRLDSFPLDIRHHGNLTLLDLSGNAIAQLSVTVRASLDVLVAKQPQPFQLRLHGNPLACTCTTLTFVRWLRSTRIRLDKGGNYSCMTDSGQLSSTATEADHWQLVWRRCVGPTVLWASVVGMLLLLSLTGLVWGVAANATRLQFLLRVFKRIKMPRRQEFLRDAYVAYCDADTEFVCLRLKEELQDRRDVRLLIKDLPRNEDPPQFWLLPGENEADKMLEHMDLCWKVILVLTPALSRDHMVGFMTRAVLQTITDRMPDRMLLLCVGVRHVPALASLRALLETVSEKQVFFLPAHDDRDHPAWDCMSDVILH